MSKEWLLMMIRTSHHLFFGHRVNLSVIVLDLSTFLWEHTSGAMLPQKNTLAQNNHLQFHTMTSKKVVRSYYCLINRE